jgi:hypothetical protein
MVPLSSGRTPLQRADPRRSARRAGRRQGSIFAIEVGYKVILITGNGGAVQL